MEGQVCTLMDGAQLPVSAHEIVSRGQPRLQKNTDETSEAQNDPVTPQSIAHIFPTGGAAQ